MAPLSPAYRFVAPRANVGGQGYVLVDVGYWLSNILGGHSLGNFRMLMQFYAFAIAVLMIVIFSRWFGILPAILGTMVIVFFSGFCDFRQSNAANVANTVTNLTIYRKISVIYHQAQSILALCNSRFWVPCF